MIYLFIYLFLQNPSFLSYRFLKYNDSLYVYIRFLFYFIWVMLSFYYFLFQSDFCDTIYSILLTYYRNDNDDFAIKLGIRLSKYQKPRFLAAFYSWLFLSPFGDIFRC